MLPPESVQRQYQLYDEFNAASTQDEQELLMREISGYAQVTSPGGRAYVKLRTSLPCTVPRSLGPQNRQLYSPVRLSR